MSGAKALMSSQIICRIWVLRPASNKKYSIHPAQIPWDSSSCYVLSLLRTNVFCSSIRNCIAHVYEANTVNKDSPNVREHMRVAKTSNGSDSSNLQNYTFKNRKLR